MAGTHLARQTLLTVQQLLEQISGFRTRSSIWTHVHTHQRRHVATPLRASVSACFCAPSSRNCSWCFSSRMYGALRGFRSGPEELPPDIV